MSKPRVTIGMTARDAADTISDALGSMAGQTYGNTELIVIDDGSKDKTGHVIDRWGDTTRAQILQGAKSLGVSRRREQIRRKANGDYLIWHDADDIWLPSRVAHLVDRAKATAADVTIDHLEYMGCDDDVRKVPEWTQSDASWTRLFERNTMNPHPLLSRRAIDTIRYREEVTNSDDYDAWLQLVATGCKFVQLDRVGMFMRRSPGGLSADHDACRKDTAFILSQYPAEAVMVWYTDRGIPDEHTQQMLVLRSMFLGDWETAWGILCMMDATPDPERFDPDFYRGTVGLHLGLEWAKEHMLRHVNRCPKSAAGWNNLALFDDTATENLLRQAIDTLPNYRDAQINLNVLNCTVTSVLNDTPRITDTQI